MSLPLVSIIIPVYNAEKYIEETLNSILRVQSSDIEIIAVDDGSKDASLAILKEYEKNYNRIKAVHKENGGASSARNAGITYASGEYIYFEDADDPIIGDVFSCGMNLCGLRKYDWIVFGYERNNNSETKRSADDNKEFYADDSWLFEKLYTTSEWNSACGKFYRREIIVDNKLFFKDNLVYGEDLLFNLYFSEQFKTGINVEKEIFTYRDTPKSVMNTFNYRRMDDTAEIIEEKCHLIEKKDISEEYKAKAYCAMRDGIRNVVEQAYFEGDSQKKERIKGFIKDTRIEHVMKEWHDRRNQTDKSKESTAIRLWNHIIYKKNSAMVFLMLCIYGVLYGKRWTK